MPYCREAGLPSGLRVERLGPRWGKCSAHRSGILKCCSHSPFSFGQDFWVHTALADPSPDQSLSPAGCGPFCDLLPSCHGGHPACFALYIHQSSCHLFLHLRKWAPPHRIPLAPAACPATAHKPERHSAAHRNASKFPSHNRKMV